MICPSCGSWVDEGDPVCPSCGAYFSDEGEYECPHCHERFYVEIIDTVCPFCGASIERPEFY